MNSGAESFELDAGQTVVLNALIDLFSEETLVLDEASEEALRGVLETATTAEERAAFREELDRLEGLSAGESTEMIPILYDVADAVTDGLADGGYSITVSHEYQQDVAPLDAHLYSYINTGERHYLSALDISSTVETALADGIELLEEGADEASQEQFSNALDHAESHTEEVVSRILTGWGYFRLGDDDVALAQVESALELEDSSWAARVVGAAVNRDEHDFVRSGKKSVGIILRWVDTGTENTTTTTEVGGRSGDEALTWNDVEHVGGHAYLDRIYPETWLRFRLQGRLPDFPQLQVYFLGLGVYDREIDYIETVIDRFGTGPHNTGSVERISIERQ